MSSSILWASSSFHATHSHTFLTSCPLVFFVSQRFDCPLTLSYDIITTAFKLFPETERLFYLFQEWRAWCKRDDDTKLKNVVHTSSQFVWFHFFIWVSSRKAVNNFFIWRDIILRKQRFKNWWDWEILSSCSKRNKIGMQERVFVTVSWWTSRPKELWVLQLSDRVVWQDRPAGRVNYFLANPCPAFQVERLEWSDWKGYSTEIVRYISRSSTGIASSLSFSISTRMESKKSSEVEEAHLKKFHPLHDSTKVSLHLLSLPKPSTPFEASNTLLFSRWWSEMHPFLLVCKRHTYRDREDVHKRLSGYSTPSPQDLASILHEMGDRIGEGNWRNGKTDSKKIADEGDTYRGLRGRERERERKRAEKKRTGKYTGKEWGQRWWCKRRRIESLKGFKLKWGLREVKKGIRLQRRRASAFDPHLSFSQNNPKTKLEKHEGFSQNDDHWFCWRVKNDVERETDEKKKREDEEEGVIQRRFFSVMHTLVLLCLRG